MIVLLACRAQTTHTERTQQSGQLAAIVLHSGKLRAEQTAQIFAPALGAHALMYGMPCIHA